MSLGWMLHGIFNVLYNHRFRVTIRIRRNKKMKKLSGKNKLTSRLVVRASVLFLIFPAFISYGQVTSSTPAEDISAKQADAYILGPGDKITVEVYPDKEYVRETRINQKGKIDLPLVGSMHWAGLTLGEAALDLEERLRGKYYRNPKVLLTMTEYRNSKVSVLGAVVNPKVITLFGKSDILRAIGEVGGLAGGSSGRIVLVRGSTVRTSSDVIVVDASRLLEQGDLSQNLPIYPGDTLFAPKSQHVYIFGQVVNPGAYAFVQGLTLLRVVALAGGFSDTAKENSVEVLHKTIGMAADERRVFYNVGDIIDHKTKDPELGPDDVVIVPESFF